jgi:hypothetical protein
MRIIACLLCVLAVQGAAALEVAGVKLDDKVKVGGSELLLNGAGVRTRFMFKVYVAALYLPARAASEREVLAQKGPKRIALTLLRDIGAERLIGGLRDGIEANQSAERIAALQARLEQLEATMRAIGEAKERSVITLDFQPESGTQVTVDGVPKGKPITGEDFYDALLQIWLGAKPVEAALKDGMLAR